MRIIVGYMALIFIFAFKAITLSAQDITGLVNLKYPLKPALNAIYGLFDGYLFYIK